jgi:aspartate kinase
MEQVIFRGIASDANQAKCTVLGVPDRPGVAAGLFKELAAANVNVDIIVQNMSEQGRTDISFTVPLDEVKKACAVLAPLIPAIRARDFHVDEKIAKVSIVGVGMKSHSGVAYKMFDVLAAEKINIEMITTSEIRISVVIREKDAARAVKALHAAFLRASAPKKAPAAAKKAAAKKPAAKKAKSAAKA